MKFSELGRGARISNFDHVPGAKRGVIHYQDPLSWDVAFWPLCCKRRPNWKESNNRTSVGGEVNCIRCWHLMRKLEREECNVPWRMKP